MDIVEAETKIYFGLQVTAYLTAAALEWYPDYPWRFKVTDADGRTHQYLGMPNYCKSKKAALKRGWYRAKWFSDGSYDSRYKKNT